MKKLTVLAALLTALCIILASCGSNGSVVSSDTQNSSTAETPTGVESGGDASYETVADPVDDTRVATGDFTVSPTDGVEVKDGVYTVTVAGEYTFSGSLSEGSIVVDASDEDEVTLILNGASITSSQTAPIMILNAAEVSVKSAEGTYNTVSDEREAKGDDTAVDGDAAIWSDCDLKINGKGTLIVTSTYDNGIKSKDDLSVKNVTLKVTSPGVALKGNDSVTVKSGDLLLISSESDGIKTSNSDISSKGNQRGIVTISGGNVEVRAACDGISAAYDVVVNEDEATLTLSVYTASYTDIADATGSTELYLILPTSMYSDKSSYYGYFFNVSGEPEGVWVEFEYETTVSGGMSTYYGLSAKVPDGYEAVAFAEFESGSSPDGDTVVPDGEAINASMNGYLVTDEEDGMLSGDWVNLTSGSGSSSKTTWSSKGIKAENAVNISAGTVNVFSGDDGIHSNSDGTLDNGDSPAGSVTVSGGVLNVTAADDGIHADGELTISGGTVNVAESHEGLEANVVTISGGSVTVCGNDDGINAFRGDKTPSINISGGTLCVTTPSGDTDGIDSNGNVTVSGGFVLVRGGAQMGSMAGSIDVDGTITVTGGTVLAFGGICEIPSGGANTYVKSGTSFAAGEYTLTDGSGATIASFTLDSTYSSLWVSSEKLTLNGSFSLSRDGSEVLSWTQSSASEGDEVQGGFGGFGGPGGRR